jgi:hypothetical protein
MLIGEKKARRKKGKKEMVSIPSYAYMSMKRSVKKGAG